MRVKIIGFTVLGVVLALAGGVGTFYYTRAIENELAAARLSLKAFGDTVEIPVPMRDAALGTVLTPQDFKLIKLPKSFVPPNILQQLPTLPPEGSLIALNDLKAQELVLQGDLAKQGEAPKFGMLPALNNRIFAVEPRNLADLRGELTPGARIDLVWTREMGGGQTESHLAASGLVLRKIGPDKAPIEAQKDPNASALAGKILLEGTQTDAFRTQVADQTGFFHILLSDGSRDITAPEVMVGPSDLSDLPLLVRDSGMGGTAVSSNASGTESILGKITGQENRRKCATAVIRGGSRSMAEVPC